jgi:hypothetical protein
MKKPPRRPRSLRPAPARRAPRSAKSLTALMADALRRGTAGRSGRREVDEIPHEGAAMRCGDPDEHALGNEYVGDDLPGGSTPTPDQNRVDDIGRAYGVQDEDAGALRTSHELLARRDRRRAELDPPRRPDR